MGTEIAEGSLRTGSVQDWIKESFGNNRLREYPEPIFHNTTHSMNVGITIDRHFTWTAVNVLFQVTISKKGANTHRNRVRPSTRLLQFERQQHGLRKYVSYTTKNNGAAVETYKCQTPKDLSPQFPTSRLQGHAERHSE